MAERRMFAKTIVLSDAFLDMPITARCLYFTLGMVADDDGFVNAPKSIIRQIGASEDDIKILIAKKFILPFDSGLIVIKHWRINNYLRTDRYQETKYIDEKSLLEVEKNGAYSSGIPSSGIPRLGKDRLGKDSKEKDIGGTESPRHKNFIPPTVEEVNDYCKERNNEVDAERFIDFYSAKDWYIGKNKMKDWKAAVRTWEKGQATKKTVRNDFEGYGGDLI